MRVGSASTLPAMLASPAMLHSPAMLLSPAMLAIGGILEGLWWIFRLKGEPPMTRFVARQLSTAHWYDISAARRDLGYSPTVSTEEGLKRLAKHLQSASE